MNGEQKLGDIRISVKENEVCTFDMCGSDAKGVDNTSVKQRRGLEKVLELLRVVVFFGDEETSYSDDSEANIQYLEIEEFSETYLTVTIGDKLVLKVDIGRWGYKEKEILKVVSQKCVEYELKAARWSKQRHLKDKTGLKKTKRNGNFVADRVPKIFPEIEVPVCVIRWNETGRWALELNLSLWFKENSINHFSMETVRFLDTLYSVAREPFMRQEITHHYIHGQFLHQTTSYTRKILNQPADLLETPWLNTKLLPFQKQSVKWMIDKETKMKRYSDVLRFLNERVSYGYEMLLNEWFWNKFSGYIITRADADALYQDYLKKEVSARGLLSEEMGLGKTIEVLALLLINPRQIPDASQQSYLCHSYGKEILKVKTNLIICPQSILQQWLDEIKLHIVDDFLTVYYYRGFIETKQELGTENISEIVKTLSKFDIIITTYTTVSAEIHYAAYSTLVRSRRHKAPKYDYSSPLSLMQFYRIILDEVQMLGSDSTNAARCTNLLHRVHTWGVSGTPIHSITDFKTVLSYLQIHPFSDFPKYIDAVSKNYKRINSQRKRSPNNVSIEEDRVFGIKFDVHDILDIVPRLDLCIRHAKHDIKDQIQIPKQHNYIVPLRFTPIEQDNYTNLWNTFLEAFGFDQNGQGTRHLEAAGLNHWLSELRKTCCHATMSNKQLLSDGNIGSGFSNAKKTGKALSLPNMDDILRTMTVNVQNSIDSLHNENYSLKIQSAQVLMELENKPREAILVLKEVEAKITAEMKNLGVDDTFVLPENKRLVSDDKDANQDVSKVNTKFRTYMDYLHQCYFFIATAYYFLGSKRLEAIDEENEKLKLTGKDENLKQYSDIYGEQEMKEIIEYQELEKNHYSKAETLRKRVLAVSAEKVESEINTLKKYFDNKRTIEKSDMQMIDFIFEDYSTKLTVATCYKNISALFKAMNEQAAQFNQLFNELKLTSFKPIAREYDETNEEDKAQEYENSINDQDKIFGLLDCLERILSNRDEIIHADETIKAHKNSLTTAEVLSPVHMEMLGNLKLVNGEPLRRIFAELKNISIVMNLASDTKKQQENFEGYLLSFEQQIGRIKKENAFMREMLKKINAIYNVKTSYFTQLQKISDSLVSLIQLEPGAKATILRNTKNDNLYLRNVKKISVLESRLKYLGTLTKLEAVMQNEQKINCAICLGKIVNGSIINCGHFFCQPCIKSWLKTKPSCPLCNSHAKLSEVYQFKFQEEESIEILEKGNAQIENAKSELKPSSSNNLIQFDDQSICSNYSDPVYWGKYKMYKHIDKIHQMVASVNYGSKVDFVIKLIKYLQLQHENTPGQKSPLQFVIYSQYTDLLDILGSVMKLNSINYVSTNKKNYKFSKVVENFKNNPDISCILLNVKLQANGLTLVNASHVFLLDPIINIGDELQAVNRIHRIGQKRETCVWNFIILNTVEENIIKYKSTLERKRLEDQKESMGIKNEDTLRSVSDEEDLTDSNEIDEKYNLNEMGDESVSEKHIWSCFFSS
ncbi:HCL110Wp [Eremothecium sinecaudum]|uniref:HCL110Wp n=1 Tax=Eremothecium sinecaudum TaxID=45286 RepID=A0A109UWM9_9SACH|nr:HCL110Wp [Eremothecium sinecaudum]AMD20041.1 HCL110Wp [Eremothecium sinecaudum]